ncbi:hypothetical protein BH09BAC5_BH09BAC5_21050 [soil metagenome]
MKNIFTFCALLFSVSTFAKTFTGNEAAQLVKGADKVIVDENRQTISFVHLAEQPVATNQVVFLKELLNAGNETDFQLYKTDVDKLGWTHYRYRQLYKNIPIEGAVYYLHTKNGKILSANGEFYSGININITSSVPVSSAVNIAKNALQTSHYGEEKYIETPSLVLFRNQENKYFLCWKVDAWSTQPMKRFYYFIDANSSKIIGQHSRICDTDSQGTASTAYNGIRTITTDSISPTSYRLFESGRNIYTHAPGPVEITDNDNNWTSTANLDNFATDAHWGIEKTHDFYLDSLGRNAQDGNGMQTDVQVHDGMYVNAYWTGTNLAFGDGDAAQYYPLTSLEIVGHEFTHGVTQYTAALVYSGESGALNESFSDIFGNTIRFLYSPSVATWLVGDEIVIPSMGGTPFRDMSNPNAFQCADTYQGLYFNNGDIVHYDSGIQNYWYYLLCDGGSGTNDIGNTFNVSGIGISDAIQITYRNLAVYLTANSTFADAATFAQQSADDLFGACSNQLVQTANAWYAVGVGNPFSGSVVANFTASPIVACSAPANVSFLNNSWNGTTFFWDFGDGNNSTTASPTHTYTLPGSYNVTLIATGTGNCVGADTLVINGAVTVNNNPGPVPASCIPTTQSYCCGYGITKVLFNTINWTSPDAIDGYSDFTCADSSLLVAGSSYPIYVDVNPNAPLGYGERVSVYIDYNNDGIFNNTNELVYSDVGSSNVTHNGIINTPVTATLNTRLRMRVISDASSNVISSACYSPQRGQVEDYMLYFIANTLPPVAMFTSDFTVIPTGNTINYADLSLHAPTGWSWTFTGGFPGTSTTQNPGNILYNTSGIYPVKLRVTNSFGADSITSTTYISVVDVANICQSANMTSNSGILYDSGGPNGDYVDNENCSFLISPCGTNLSLSFTQFDIEYSYDFLRVYDGINNAAPLLGSFTGNTVPPTLYSTSGKLYIEFSSDWSVTYSGFAATWSSTPVGIAPVANYSYAPSVVQVNVPVQFTDLTANSPSAWFWDFGDLGTSTAQNPSHTYLAAGTYTVTLITTNCMSSDTVFYIVNVNPDGIEENIAGEFSVYPNPFSSFTIVHFSDNVNMAEIRIEICDLSGRIVGNALSQNHDIEINRNGLSNGLYFMNIYSGSKLTASRKIIIGE